MSDNIIFNSMDESIGYYDDLYKSLADVAKQAIDDGDIELAKEQLEYLGELSEWDMYADLLVLSMNNGMGFTCNPYKPKELQDVRND